MQQLLLLLYTSLVSAAGYRTVGSSGCTVQMVFLPPYTDTAVFIDKLVSILFYLASTNRVLGSLTA